MFSQEVIFILLQSSLESSISLDLYLDFFFWNILHSALLSKLVKTPMFCAMELCTQHAIIYHKISFSEFWGVFLISLISKVLKKRDIKHKKTPCYHLFNFFKPSYLTWD